MLTNELHKRIEDFDRLREKSLRPAFPRKMLLEVTNLCNDRCIFCANSKTTRKKSFMDPAFAADVMEQAYALGMREVGFYATGEPLLHKELERIVRSAKDIGYEYTYITTNGALLDAARAESLVAAGIDSVKVSLNATNAWDYHFVHGTDDYEKVLANIRSFDAVRKKAKKHINFFISCVTTEQTETPEDAQTKLLEQLGDFVDDIDVVRCMDQGGMMPEDELLGAAKHVAEEDYCQNPFHRITVSSEGYLTLCCTDFQNYLAVADLHKESLASAWNNEAAVGLRKKFLEHHLDGTLCGHCLHGMTGEVRPLRKDLCVPFTYETLTSREAMKKRIAEHATGERR